MSDTNLRTQMGLQGDVFRLGIDWFDHNNVSYYTVVQARVLEADKPRTLVVEVATTQTDDEVGRDELDPVCVYKMVGGSDPYASRMIQLEANPVVKEMRERIAELETEVDRAETLLRKAVVGAVVNNRPLTSEDVLDRFTAKYYDVTVDTDLVCTSCASDVHVATLKGTNLAVYWCINSECQHALGEWRHSISSTLQPSWVKTATKPGDTVLVEYLKPGQRFRLEGARFIIPDVDPGFSRSVSVPPFRKSEGNATLMHPMKLVGRDVAGEDALSKGIRLEWMNPYTEVEVL